MYKSTYAPLHLAKTQGATGQKKDRRPADEMRPKPYDTKVGPTSNFPVFQFSNQNFSAFDSARSLSFEYPR